VAGFFIKRNLPGGTKLVLIDASSNPLENLADFVLKGNESNTLKALTAALVSSKEDSSPVGEAAKVIAASKRPVVVYSKANSDLLKAILEFARASGASKTDYQGIISTKGQANSMAASQYKLDSVLNVDGYKAAYIALGDEEPSQKLIQSLSKIGFLAVQASYTSQLTAMASVVLPAANWLEQDGHYVSLDGRIQKASAALKPANDIWTNEAILKALAERLGFSINADLWKKELTQAVAQVAIAE
jgi:predicted molibdopterin-dependent oxidoreductase YjgC